MCRSAYTGAFVLAVLAGCSPSSEPPVVLATPFGVQYTAPKEAPFVWAGRGVALTSPDDRVPLASKRSIDYRYGVYRMGERRWQIHPDRPGFRELEPGAEPEKPAWDDFWKTDLEIEGPVEDQIALRTWLFHLRLGMHPNDPVPPGPHGRTSDRYGNRIFWDSDVWVFPALMLIDPERARVIPRFRLRTLRTEDPPVPWESGPIGEDLTPEASRKHASAPGSAAFALGWAVALGMVTPAEAKRYRTRVANYYRQRISGYEFRSVRSIDEFAESVNNDLYTNLVAMHALNGGDFAGPHRLKLPRDDRSFLNYDDDPERVYQQTAALLAAFPLQYPPAEAQTNTLLTRFASKVSIHGPAMSQSIHATLWARIGQPEKAYAEWRRGRALHETPWFQPVEFRKDADDWNAGVFLTGAAGYLNAVLYGFLGFRIDSTRRPDSRWSHELEQGYWLNLTPRLPKAWRSVTLRGLVLNGQRYTLTATHDDVQVIQGD